MNNCPYCRNKDVKTGCILIAIGFIIWPLIFVGIYFLCRKKTGTCNHS